MEEIQGEAGAEPWPQFCGIVAIGKSSKGELSASGGMYHTQIKVAEVVK